MNRNGLRKEADAGFYQNQRAFDWTVDQDGSMTLDGLEQELAQRTLGTKTGLYVGCASGALPLSHILRGGAVLAVDASPACIDHCKKHFEGEYATAFTQMLPADMHKLDKKYEVVVVQTLFGVEDIPSFLRMLFDKVTDGGKLHVLIPADGIPRQLVLSLAAAIEDGYPRNLQQLTGHHAYILSFKRHRPKVKYLQTVANRHHAREANAIQWSGQVKTGVWNWVDCLDGQAKAMKDIDNLDGVDVAFCQVSGHQFDYISRLRAMAKDTQIVACVDYALEWWHSFPPFPSLLLDQLNAADHVFAVEPRQARLLQSLLQRPVPVIPHPAKTEVIKEFYVLPENREGAIVVSHRDVQTVPAYWMLHDQGLSIHGMGPHLATLDGPTVSFAASQFDTIDVEHLSGKDAVLRMASKRIAVDSYSHSVSGRSTIELAALGVPTVGSRNIHAMTQLFPMTCIEQGDIGHGRELVRTLLDDKEFYKDVADGARSDVESFNYANAEHRFMEMIDVHSRSGLRQTPEELRFPTSSPVDGEPVEAEISAGEVGDLQEGSG